MRPNRVALACLAALIVLGPLCGPALAAAWKTYGSKDANVQFAVPADWKIERNQGENGVVWSGTDPRETMGMLLTVLKSSDQTVKQMFKDFAKQCGVKIDKSTIESDDTSMSGVGTTDQEIAIIVAADEDGTRMLLMLTSDQDAYDKNSKTLTKICDSMADYAAGSGEDEEQEEEPSATAPSKTEPDEEEAAESEETEQEKEAAPAKPPLQPGEWKIDVGIDGQIYPSLVIATSTMKLDDEQDPTELGDPMGLIGVEIAAPTDNCPVTVEIASTKLIHPSTFTGVLPKKGETYYVYPVLKYDYDGMLAVRQPFPELVSAKVSLNGRPAVEMSERVCVRSINDCVLGFEEDGEWVDTSWLFAAYVNESHPVIDQILKEALDAESVDSFAGYQGSKKDVKREIKAIWDALQARGFRYSNVTRASGESETVLCQNVRLVGDQIKTSQANCVEGSALFASILRKLDMDPFFVIIPGHAFVGVFLDKDQEDYCFVETTMLGNASFEEAVKTANGEFDEYSDCLLSDESEDEDSSSEDADCQIIDIGAARQIGVMPIAER